MNETEFARLRQMYQTASTQLNDLLVKKKREREPKKVETLGVWLEITRCAINAKQTDDVTKLRQMVSELVAWCHRFIPYPEVPPPTHYCSTCNAKLTQFSDLVTIKPLRDRYNSVYRVCPGKCLDDKLVKLDRECHHGLEITHRNDVKTTPTKLERMASGEVSGVIAAYKAEFVASEVEVVAIADEAIAPLPSEFYPNGVRKTYDGFTKTYATLNERKKFWWHPTKTLHDIIEERYAVRDGKTKEK